MVLRSRASRSPRNNIPNRPVSYINRSPRIRSSSRGRSPKQHTTTLKHNDARTIEDHKPRGRYRGRDQRRRGNPRGVENNGRAHGNNQSGNRNKGRKWGRSMKKKRKRNLRGRGGGNGPPVSGGNRQPIASMRMRMDDYLPRSGRLLPAPKANEIEHAVARARREASTRTKDTFWTKKLLDAETSIPNRWAHTGFKEMYREELGYSGSEYKSGDEKLGKYSREDRGTKSSTSKNVREPLSRRRSPSDMLQRNRKHTSQSPSRNMTEKTKDSHNRVSDSKTKYNHSVSGASRLSRTSKISPLKPNKRHYSRSYSRSLSSLSSSSDSDSRSRSYSSSYSRSSYSNSTTSSSSTSSFTTSSSVSLGSYKKRYSRHSYSRSTSRSLSPRRHQMLKSPPSSKKAPKILVSKTTRTEAKKKVPKIVNAPIKRKVIHSASTKAKLRPHSPRDRSTKISVVSKSGVPNTNINHDSSLQNEYYDPSVITEDSPPYRAPPGRIEKTPTSYDPEQRRPPADLEPRLPTADTDPIPHRASNSETKSRAPNIEVKNRGEIRHRASNADVHVRVSNPEVQNKILNPDTLNQTLNSEVRSRSSNPGNSKRALNPERRKGVSESGHRRDLSTGTRLAADLQRYKNSRLTRNTCQDTTILHPSGIRLKRERRSHSESSSEEEEYPMKLTLSERFGKLAQLSSQRQEYDGVRMKIVREGGQDKKVYLEGGSSRTPSPYSRRSDGAHERWVREHKAEYDEYQQLYGEFRHWDPHRDLPNDLPPNWDDINVRYRYYKESGYFGDRAITMDDYLKWEEWWYRYKDWLEKYGGSQETDYRGGPNFYDIPRASTSSRWSRREAHREKEERKRMRYQ